MKETTPMQILEELSLYFNSRILTCVDNEYNIVVHINDIDRLYKKKYLCNLEGRGITYRDACVDYINNLMDKAYTIRYKKELYATEPLRRIVKSKIIEDTDESEELIHHEHIKQTDRELVSKDTG